MSVDRALRRREETAQKNPKVVVVTMEKYRARTMDLSIWDTLLGTTVSDDGTLVLISTLNGSIKMATISDMVFTTVFSHDDVTWGYPTDGYCTLPDISSDNRYILYTTKIYDTERGATYEEAQTGTTMSNGLNTICLLDRQTGEHQVLVEGGRGPLWVDGDRFIAYRIDDYRKYTIGISAAVDDDKWALYDTVTGEHTLFSDAMGTDISYADFVDNGTICCYFIDGSSYFQQLYRSSLDGSSVTQVSNFDYSSYTGTNTKILFTSIAISSDEEWAVVTANANGTWPEFHGVNYLLMYEISTGRVFSLFTGEEFSSDLHELVEYEQDVYAAYNDPNDNSAYGESLFGYGGNYDYTINGVEYDYDEFHLVRPSFAGWCSDGETLIIQTQEAAGGALYYKSFDSEFYKSSPAVVEDDAPVAFPTLASYPNPFNPRTTLSFTLPEGGLTNVVIYNLAGQKVRNLVSGVLAPGSHEVVWDGRDDSGMPVSSGVFVSQLKTGDTVVTNRMTLVK